MSGVWAAEGAAEGMVEAVEGMPSPGLCWGVMSVCLSVLKMCFQIVFCCILSVFLTLLSVCVFQGVVYGKCLESATGLRG